MSVIDPATYKVIETIPVQRQPQHVTPSWDLKTLWVLNDLANSLTEIDPMTGKEGQDHSGRRSLQHATRPTGKFAIVVAEARQRLMFPRCQNDGAENSCLSTARVSTTWTSLADGRFLIASCEFSGTVLKVDVAEQKVVGRLLIDPKAMPQDVKTSPDGKVFYVADMMSDGVHMIEP